METALKRAVHDFMVANYSMLLKEQEEARQARLIAAAEAFPLQLAPDEDLGKLLAFSPRWTKVRACTDFALNRPGDRLAGEVGRTPTNWVFAVE